MSRSNSPGNFAPILQENRHVTPIKDKRSISVSRIPNSALQRRENLPDIHFTPSTSRTNTHGDEKQGKDFIIAKVRAQNETLKKQVKDLNNKLTSSIINTTTKKASHRELDPTFSEELLRKQLQNAYKQMDNYKKQLQVFVGNGEAYDYYEKMNKLEDLLMEKNNKLEEVMIEKKVLEKINREQDRELEAYKNTTGYEKKINNYLEEIRCLREKISNMQAINRHNEQSFKKQQEHVVGMTRQYRLVCDRVGIPANSNFSRPEDLERIISKRRAIRAQEELNNDFEEAYVASKDNSAILKKVLIKKDRSNSLPKDRSMLYKRNSSVTNIHNLKEIEVSSNEEKYKREIEKLTTRIYLLKSENKHIKSELKERDSEKRIISCKANPDDIRRGMIKQRSLSRINLTKNADAQRVSMTYSNIHDSTVPSKSEIDIEVDQNKYIPAKAAEDSSAASSQEIKDEPAQSQKQPLLIVRKVNGGRSGPGLSEFNDKEYLPTPLASKITKLMVWSDDEYIYGIQAFYKVQDTYYVVGEEHIGTEMKRKAKVVTSIEMEADDQIWWISGKYDEGITYLKVKTVKGLIKEFGTKEESPNEFKITAESNEQMTLLHGAYYYKKGGDNTEDVVVLANLGFTLFKETTH